MSIKENIYNLVLPEKYQEGIITYRQGLDGDIDYYRMNLSEHGYTKEKYTKLKKLISIEAYKKSVQDDIEYGELTNEEIEFTKQAIKTMIDEYNSMPG